MSNHYALSVDVGGTFTDFVLFDMNTGATAAFHKVLTDAARPARAVVQGWLEILAQVGGASTEVEYAVHSTTIVTNAIVERRGVKAALITTRGFRDVLEIGIEQIYNIYDLFAPYPVPLIPRELRREVDERISRDGTVLEPLDDAQVLSLVTELAASGVGSIAVSLIHGYRNPNHERRIGQIIAEMYPDIAVSLSSQVAPLIGEYERTSTVAADAYVKPILRDYVLDLVAQLRDLGFLSPLYMILSSGGIATAEAAMELPIRLLESGPAAGAYAAGFYGGQTGHEFVLSLDMGGTTAKACLVERGRPALAKMLEADRVHRFQPGSGLPIMAPTVDLIEIGAGGGSIAHVNNLGLLQVGPRSAAAAPGPASYGLGGDQPTVTDANIMLGYLDPDYFLGGTMRLQPERASAAIEAHITKPLDLRRIEAAAGIHAVVNENMAQAARTHLIERNRDPRNVAIVAFGGAGPAHAVEIARILGSREVIVPFGAGVASAIGALTAPMSLPFVRSYMTLLADTDWSLVQQLLSEMQDDARHAFHGVATEADVEYQVAADMRFAGQYHEIRVELPSGPIGAQAIGPIETAFHAAYEKAYGRAPSSLRSEVLNWHLTAEIPRRILAVGRESSGPSDYRQAQKGERDVYLSRSASGSQRCIVYDRYRLQPGAEFSGPCIIEEREATTVIPPGCQVMIDGYRNIVITLEGDESA